MINIMVEQFRLTQEVERMSDEDLMEVVSMLLSAIDFSKEVDDILGKYLKYGVLSVEQRKKVEGAYKLYKADHKVGV